MKRAGDMMLMHQILEIRIRSICFSFFLLKKNKAIFVILTRKDFEINGHVIMQYVIKILLQTYRKMINRQRRSRVKIIGGARTP